MSFKAITFGAAVAVLTLGAAANAAPAAHKPHDSLADAQAGQAAIDRGDNAAAIPLFSKALSGKLSTSDRELALVKRGEAYLATGQRPLALQDARAALALQPTDNEALSLRDKSGGGPSLEATITFVRSKVVGQGPINLQVFTHDGKSGQDTSFTKSTTYTDFTIAEHCVVHVPYKVAFNDAASGDGMAGIDLSKLRHMKLWAYADFWTSRAADDGHPEQISQVSPSRFVVKFDGDGNWIEMKDQDDATAVAKALDHAIDLCGGGSKDLF
jgi:tetratricopeptide (TPR) repeat protein